MMFIISIVNYPNVGKYTKKHTGRLTWNMSSWRFGRSVSFQNGWLVGSMLIFQGVRWASVKTKSHCHSFLWEQGPPLSTPRSHAAESPPLWGYNTRFTHMYIYIYIAHTRLEMCWMVIFVHLHIHIYIYIISIKMLKNQVLLQRENMLFCYYEHSGLAGKNSLNKTVSNHKLDM